MTDVTWRCLSIGLIHAPLSLAQSPPDRRGFWDDLFQSGKTRFNKEASKLLQYAISDRKPGAAIDLGMGEGRNAILLASKGWMVTGVDYSEVAVRQAKSRALTGRVAIDAVTADLDRFVLGREKWDLIALIYMHAWFHESKRDVPKILIEALKPGGLLVVEGYAGADGHAYRSNELVRKFDDLRIVHYEDVHDEADWAPGAKSRLVRFIAEKPAPGK